MRTYKRSTFGLVKSIVQAPVSGVLVFFITQFFLPVPVCLILGLAVAAILLYMALFSENIFFELEDDGVFRYFKRGKPENTFDLKNCRIGYYRKSESGFAGNHDINLRILDGEGTETSIDAAPLGVTGFHEMFEEMQKFAIKDEPVWADNKKEE
jgi:hypothetical protein